jgi:hypothetical protein
MVKSKVVNNAKLPHFGDYDVDYEKQIFQKINDAGWKISEEGTTFETFEIGRDKLEIVSIQVDASKVGQGHRDLISQSNPC